MAYSYGKTSTRRKLTCKPPLQRLADELIKYLDVTVVCGKRGPVLQHKAVLDGNSEVEWPDSNHNMADDDGNETDELSDAIDLAPYMHGDIVWKKKSAAVMAGMVLLIAEQLEIAIRWGGDWDMDKDFEDQSFNDLWHFELVNGGVK